VKPPPLEYRRAADLDDALQLLAEHGDESKVLAGGQSLISLLNFRLSRPSLLIDIGQVDALQVASRSGEQLSVGALVTHHMVEVARGDPVYRGYEVLPESARWIGHLPIRTRGTFGGSMAHGDPAAEWPLLCTALGAKVVLARASGTRSVAIDDFYVGFLTTSMAEDELLLRVDFQQPPMGAALAEFSRRPGDFAIVAAAASLEWSPTGRCTAVRIAVGGVDSTPLRVPAAEGVLLGEQLEPGAVEEAASVAARSVSPSSDIHGTARYRRHLVRVLTANALRSSYGGVAA